MARNLFDIALSTCQTFVGHALDDGQEFVEHRCVDGSQFCGTSLFVESRKSVEHRSVDQWVGVLSDIAMLMTRKSSNIALLMDWFCQTSLCQWGRASPDISSTMVGNLLNVAFDGPDF